MVMILDSTKLIFKIIYTLSNPLQLKVCISILSKSNAPVKMRLGSVKLDKT